MLNDNGKGRKGKSIEAIKLPIPGRRVPIKRIGETINPSGLSGIGGFLNIAVLLFLTAYQWLFGGIGDYQRNKRG